MHYEYFLHAIVVSYTYLEDFVYCFFFKKKPVLRCSVHAENADFSRHICIK